MDWNKLKNVPAGIADGVDATSGTSGAATDVDCNDCVGSRDLGAIRVRLTATDADEDTNPIIIAFNDNHSAEYRFGEAEAKCFLGELPLDGGARWSYTGVEGDGGIITVTSQPFLDSSDGRWGWRVRAGHDTNHDITLSAWVLCLAA